MDASKDDLDASVFRALQDRGLNVTWGFAGLVDIEVTPRKVVSTCQQGWEYGTVSVVDDDGVSGPLSEAAEPEGIDEHTTDPELIASAWAAWVERERSNEAHAARTLHITVDLEVQPREGLRDENVVASRLRAIATAIEDGYLGQTLDAPHIKGAWHYKTITKEGPR